MFYYSETVVVTTFKVYIVIYIFHGFPMPAIETLDVFYV